MCNASFICNLVKENHFVSLYFVCMAGYYVGMAFQLNEKK